MASPKTLAAALEREEKICDLTDRLAEVMGEVSPIRDVALAALARLAHSVSRGGEQTNRAAKTASNGYEPGGHTGKLLAALRKKPGMPIPDLAEAIYGQRDREAQGRVRSLLAAQKKAERVDNTGRGHWEVID